MSEKPPISVTHPHLAKEAVGWDPSKYSFGSHAKLDWKCSQGHNFSMILKSRTLQNYGCPICSGKKIMPGFNDLQTLFPELAKELINGDATIIGPWTKKKAEWKCSTGHTWLAAVANRTSNQSGCPFCANKEVFAGFNDLKSLFPDIAAQADGWDPTQVLAGTKKKYKWKCQQNHKWTAEVGSRTFRNLGCPTCSNRKLSSGVNDLASTHPAIAKQADDWDPSEFIAGSKKKMKWICPKGHRFERSIAYRTSRNSDCPICSNSIFTPGVNDLASTHPDLAKEADGWDPTQVSASTHKKLQWKCSKGHTWKATGSNRAGRQSNCPVCANRVVLKGFNDLQSTHGVLSREACGWDPTEVTSGSHLKKRWICGLGHEWTATVNSRATAGHGCPYCSNSKVLAGFNDLASQFPEIAREADGWDPSTFVAGSGTKKPWKCEFGHKWNAQISNRTVSGTNCPSCTVGGFDPNKDGWLYFLRHENWGLLQVGISNVLDKRLYSHKRAGWIVVETKGPYSGDVAYLWEQSILKFLKINGAILGNKDVAGNFSGYTESWFENSFPVKSLSELMRQVQDAE